MNINMLKDKVVVYTKNKQSKAILESSGNMKNINELQKMSTELSLTGKAYTQHNLYEVLQQVKLIYSEENHNNGCFWMKRTPKGTLQYNRKTQNFENGLDYVKLLKLSNAYLLQCI